MKHCNRCMVLLLCVLALQVVGCDATPLESEEPTTSLNTSSNALSNTAAMMAMQPRTNAQYDYIFRPGEPMKHAYRTVWSHPSLKADNPSDIRYMLPDRYAITDVPPETIRPMVEWEPMKALILSVPGYLMTSNYANARNTILQIAKHAATVTEVWVILESANTQGTMEGLLLDEGVSQEQIDSQMKFIVATFQGAEALINPQQDGINVWIIDSGPLPIVDEAAGTFAFADFRYFHDRVLDDGVPTWLGQNGTTLGLDSNITTYRAPLNTEGGTFQATSDGICFTGDGQLLWMSYDTGQPDYSIMTMPLTELQTHPLAEEVRSIWKQYAGCKDTIFTNSISDDGTLHLDMYLKVVADDTIVIGEYVEPFANDAQEENKARMDETVTFLENYEKQDGGGGFTVKRLIMPGHRSTSEGDVPFTYANSTIINGLNLWPAYSFPEWEASRDVAEAQWEDAMPEHTHIWIDSEELSFWSGAIHCVTRTIPDKTPSLWVDDGTCTDGVCAAPEGGYVDECSPNGIAYEVCYGPNWLCTCNNCESGCSYVYDPDAPVIDGCGDVTYAGCCDGDTLTWCEDAEIETIACGENETTCGWQAENGFYNCDQTGEDPSGAYPIDCDGSVSCEPDCTGKVCGDDGCGGSCGTCGGSLPFCAGSECLESDPCADMPFSGCCNGEIVTWCEEGVFKEIDCVANSTTCGWQAEAGFYNCEQTGVDPSGVNPIECPGACAPDCTGKVCGDDGCGGDCGSCDVGTACDGAGACQVCESDCTGKLCGDDGCGGMCGYCGDFESCNTSGACSSASCGEEYTAAGMCQGNTLVYCEGDLVAARHCADEGLFCGATQDSGVMGCVAEGTCTPYCEGKVCGDDGCGGSCGEGCAEGQVCSQGACQTAPVETPDSEPTVDAGSLGEAGAGGASASSSDAEDESTTSGSGSSGGCHGNQPGPLESLPTLFVVMGLMAITSRRFVGW